MKMPLCECGQPLGVSLGYTGADWDSEAGERSGYGWELSLVCTKCSRFYPLAFAKDEQSISWHIGVKKYE